MGNVVSQLSIWFEIVIVLGAIAAAAVYITSTVRKQRDIETARLVETRGQRNHDLREEIEELRREVAELRGSLDAMQRIKAVEIADEVVTKVVPFLEAAFHTHLGGGN